MLKQIVFLVLCGITIYSLYGFYNADLQNSTKVDHP